MLLGVIGELRIGTCPRAVMATRPIVPEERCGRLVGTASCLRAFGRYYFVTCTQPRRLRLEGASRTGLRTPGLLGHSGRLPKAEFPTEVLFQDPS